MINADDPPPLDAPASGSPESLVRALRALGREQPSDAALRATGLRLQARLLAPPITTTVEPVIVHVATTKTLLAGRLIMAALTAAVGVGSYMLVGSGKPESEQPSASKVPLPLAAPPSDSVHIAVPPEFATPRVIEPSTTTTTHSATSSSPAPRRADPVRVASPNKSELRRTRELAARSTSGRSETAITESATSIVASTTERASPLATRSVAPPTAPQPSATERAAEPKESAAAAGELALMRSAQKQSHVDPRSVLRLAAEHARRFPEGVLAPEREVLAIEALRALGQNVQADERLRKFRATYPDSLHTRALTKSATP